VVKSIRKRRLLKTHYLHGTASRFALSALLANTVEEHLLSSVIAAAAAWKTFKDR
jgi:hypothetical protein